GGEAWTPHGSGVATTRNSRSYSAPDWSPVAVARHTPAAARVFSAAIASWTNAVKPAVSAGASTRVKDVVARPVQSRQSMCTVTLVSDDQAVPVICHCDFSVNVLVNVDDVCVGSTCTAGWSASWTESTVCAFEASFHQSP